MHFLIDADSLIYKAGCANEERWYDVLHEGMVVADFMYKADAVEFVDGDETLEIEFNKKAGPLKATLKNVKTMVNRILKQERCTSYGLYIGGKDNFRYEIDPNYKGNRDKKNKPIHEQKIRDYLIRYYGAIVIDGVEVDDAVSYMCMEEPETSVIASIDKDLDNTPGFHYNYDKENYYYVSPEEADLNFYRQLLSGDSTDGIVGVKGIGKARATEILKTYLTPERMCSIVWKVYQDKGYDWEYFVNQGRLLWMMREEDVLWAPPIGEEDFYGEQ